MSSSIPSVRPFISTSSGSRYELGTVIGVGTYGEVRYAVLQSTGENFAAKIVEFSRYSLATQTLLKREIDILRELDHENCISIHEICEEIPFSGRFCDQCACTQFVKRNNTDNNSNSNSVHSCSFSASDSQSPLLVCTVCGHSGLNHGSTESRRVALIVQELAVGGELFGIISQTGPLPEDFARHYFRQLVKGLEFLHRRGIIHRDLKLENLCIDSSLNLRIIDFGLAAFNSKAQKKNRRNSMGGELSDEDLSDAPQFEVEEEWATSEPMLHTGVGCLEGDSQILLASGKSKMIKLLTTEDKLMDPEGNLQSVESIVSGRARFLYRIMQSNYEPYLVTFHHELALRYRGSNHCWIDKQLSEHQISSSELELELFNENSLSVGAIVKIRVSKFLGLSSIARSCFTAVNLNPASNNEFPIRIERLTCSNGELFQYFGVRVSHASHLLLLADGQVTGNSLPYSSPEVFYREVYQHQPYNGAAADVYSCGVVLFILLHAKPPFLRSLLKSYGTQYKRDKHFIAFMRGEGPIAQTNEVARDLIMKMMKLDPAERLTIQQIKEHPFFTGSLPDDDLIQSVMEERAIKTWSAAENFEMVQVLKSMIAEQRSVAAPAIEHSAAIPIPRRQMPNRAKFVDKQNSLPFSLANPASLPNSFAVSPSFSLQSGSQGAEEYLNQHDRARASERNSKKFDVGKAVALGQQHNHNQPSPISGSFSNLHQSPEASPLAHAISGMEIESRDSNFSLEPIEHSNALASSEMDNSNTQKSMAIPIIRKK